MRDLSLSSPIIMIIGMTEIYIKKITVDYSGLRVHFSHKVNTYWLYMAGSRPGGNASIRLFPYQYSIPEVIERIQKWSLMSPTVKATFVDIPCEIEYRKKYLRNSWYRLGDKTTIGKYQRKCKNRIIKSVYF